MDQDCPRWEDERHDDSPRAAPLRRRVEALVRRIAAGAAEDFGAHPTRTLAAWHRELFEGLVPLDCYAGNLRAPNAEHRCLTRNVRTGGGAGADWREMLGEMDAFDEATRRALRRADALAETAPPGEWEAPVLETIARVAAEIIRIHPFIDGNGRASRLATAWLLRRYGLPADAVRVDASPEAPYVQCARAAMAGDHLPMRDYLLTRVGLRSAATPAGAA